MKDLIHSSQNPLFKQLQRVLADKEKQHCVLEGVHLCQMYLQKYGVPRCAVFSQEAFQNQEIQTLYQAVKDRSWALFSSSLFKQVSQVPSPQGVLFLIDIPTPSPSAKGGSVVLLDRIQDPGNLGTMIRTAVAAGIQDMYLSVGCTKAWSSKVLRSAQGAHFYINLHLGVDLDAWIRASTLPVMVTTLSERSTSLYDLNLKEDCAWLLGNEGQGVRSELQALCTHHVFIPQSDQVESLNVGVACGIVLFEQRRQQKGCFSV